MKRDTQPTIDALLKWIEEANGRSEGRQYERNTTQLPVRLITEQDGGSATHFACIIDVSERGARLLTHALLRRGDVFVLTPSGGPGYAVHARVVWEDGVRSTRQKEFGVEFLNPFPTVYWRFGYRPSVN